MKFNLQLGSFNLSVGDTSAKSVDLSAGARAWLAGKDVDSTGTSLGNAYQQSTWVYACVSLLAESLANVKFKFESANDEEIEQGPLVELFRRPHPRLNRFQFWELVVTWLGLRGEYFIAAIDASGEPVNFKAARRGGLKIAQLCLLSPDKMQHKVYDNELMAWEYTSNPLAEHASYVFAPEEIIHDRVPNPFNDWRGFSPLTVARLAAESDFASAQFEKGLMMNNGDTGVIITTEQQLSEEQRLAVQKALEERKRRAGTADRPLFLFGGAKVEKPTIASADMQFLENRKYKRQEICAIYKVPQELLGYTEDANRSVGDAARLNFMENRIAPMAKRIETAVEPIVRGIDPTADGEFDIDSTPVMQAAQRARWDGALKGFGMGYSANELNKAFDLGMPDHPDRDKRYLPFSLQEVGVDALQDTPVPANDQPPQDNTGKAVDRALEILSKATPAAAHQCGANTAYASAIAGSVKKKRTVLRNFFTAQQSRVLAKLDQSQASIDTLRTMAGLITEAELKAIDDIFDMLAENEKLLGKMTPLLKGDLLFGGSQVWQELGLNADDFAVPPQKAIDFLAKRSNEIKGVNKTTFEKLKGSLAEGLQDGDTHAELVDRVKEVYQGATDARAETIATTETNIAVNSGRFEGMQEAGVERKGWQASNLEGVRPEHLQAEMDYQDEGVPLDEPFIVAGEELMHPGDPGGSPGNTINCRCFSFAILPGKSIQPKQILTFETWLARATAKGVNL